ncbi:MAG: DUF1926 domain-containing protein, partial [Planctomycetaceae bacterium]|nr:DUF1926 domain-containing protein [Planctomycetaceae bacterium]
ELDVQRTGVNLLATLDRRPEPYHQRILNHLNPDAANAEDDQFLAAISDTVKLKQPGLDRKLVIDHSPHKSLVDHFLRPQLSQEEFRRGEGGIGDFVTGTYEASIRRGDTRIAVEMRRRGTVGGLEGELRKVVILSADHPNEILIHYQVTGFPTDVPLHLGVELNFAAMPGGADDRYFYDHGGARLGTLDKSLSLNQAERLSLVDEWLGMDVTLEMSHSGGIWTMPVETVSQSEGGFEAVQQSVCVIPHWEFTIPANGTWSVELRMIIDTSMASARQLAKQTESAAERPVAGTVR